MPTHLSAMLVGLSPACTASSQYSRTAATTAGRGPYRDSASAYLHVQGCWQE